MASAAGQAVFAVVARDAASKVLKGVGKSFGNLKNAGQAALGAMKTAALAAGAAMVALGVAAVKGAIDDERSTVKLNAALKQRGFNLETLQPKIQEQIKSMQHLGVSDDEVRAGLEVGSRFFKKQGDLLKANSAAANVSAVTGKSLAEVQGIIGKATQGQTRGLKGLGIEMKKGASLTEILAAVNKKYGGIAEELANTTSGKLLTAQVRFGEAMDSFGGHILPVVSGALDWLATNIMPGLETAFDTAGAKVAEFLTGLGGENGIGAQISKLNLPDFGKTVSELGASFGEAVTGVGELAAALWGDGSGPMAAAVKFLIEAFNNLLGVVGKVLDVVSTIASITGSVITGATALSQNPNLKGGYTPSYGGGAMNYNNAPAYTNVSIGFVPDWAKLETVIDNRIGEKVPSTGLPRYYTPGGQ